MATSLKSVKATAIGPVIKASGVSAGVKITGVSFTSGASAADPAGSETVTVNGSGFNTGAKVYIDTTSYSTTYANSSALTFTSPAKSIGAYNLYVYNTDGSSGILPGGMVYSSLPTWVTASGELTIASQNSSYSQSVSATGDGTITYSITSGNLPTGLSLNTSTGAITGTAPNTTDTSTFTITAADSQNQSVSRSFSIRVSVPVTPTVEYLVVAGGGGGGGTQDSAGGGGGAGGLLTATGYSITAGTPITVTVGAGGTSIASTTGTAYNGNDSVFGSITTKGGGGGGCGRNSGGNRGADGGSGGGEGGGAGLGVGKGVYPGSSYISATRQGYDGGTSYGGGGGAGGIGTNGIGGIGGQGLQSSITGSSLWYAAGGSSTSTVSTNSIGGAGDSGSYTGSTDGVTNTGSGGGAAWSASLKAGKSGGSGVVIIRYPDTYPLASSTTGSPTVTNPTGYRVYKFTSSGSITF